MVVMMVVLAPLTHAADIAPELWDRPRSAQRVMVQPAVQQAVVQFLGHRSQARHAARIVIVHNTRQESQLQAEELRAWLVALAVDRVQLRADQGASLLRIEVTEVAE
jgi:hypothetical protein